MTEINQMEVVLNIFMIEDGELKILLSRKKEDPYKGYWLLPNKKIMSHETIDEVITSTMIGDALLPREAFISCRQGKLFDALDRKVEERIFAISYNCIIDSRVVNEKQLAHSVEDLNWFTVNTLPKLAFDHEYIIDCALDNLKDHILYYDALQELFPSDFTLPELQKVYEMITRKNCDRRNFRKKFIEQGLLEDTGYKTTGTTGRPAKLYRFKEKNIKSDIL